MTLEEEGEHTRTLTRRLGVYLTNTLDEPHDVPLQSSLFGVVESIAEESKLASRVKKEYPILALIGNPPYSGISQNKHYTDNNVYKVEPGGKDKLKEKKNWLDDDYVKFIRFTESMIEKNGEGVVGMITAHGYLDNPTFRGMRWHLRETFDDIYVLDLHGNANKKETAPDGSKDENVFDIKTGVAIIFGVKTRTAGARKKPAVVHHAELYGTRKEKFSALADASIETLRWRKLPHDADVWRVEGKGKAEYMQGFSVAELFPKNTTGIVTMGDSFIIDMDKKVLEKRVADFLENDISDKALQAKYELGKNYAKWIVDNKKKIAHAQGTIAPFAYRPFDTRFTYFDKNLVWRTREQVMKHFVAGENVGLEVCRQVIGDTWDHVFLTTQVVDDSYVSNRSRERGYCMPLYLYTDSGEKVPNLAPEIVARIEETAGTTTPEDILDYVYAYLHAPSYRAKYGEFLKADFPRVPYPASKEQFWKLVPLGTKLRGLHLLTDPAVTHSPVSFPVSDTNVVEKVALDGTRVYINAAQYFEGVPKSVWNFYIGGYQPAQKYLKDRKGRTLTNAEFEQYEKIVASLALTIETMADIDSAIPVVL